MMPYCAHAGMAVTTFSPLARGYLAGGGADGAHRSTTPSSTGSATPIDREIARRTAEVAEARGVAAGRRRDGLGGGAIRASPRRWSGPTRRTRSTRRWRRRPWRSPPRSARILEAPYRPRDMINDYNPVRRARALAEAEGRTA